jgi:alkylation response protein AidB-like acyl-CoA dehydrogenase
MSMDFELTKSQKEIQKAAREFARGEFDKELALEMDKKHQFPTKIWKKACDLGFVGVHFPEEYSGQDLGVLENIIIADEFCARDSFAPEIRASDLQSFYPVLPPSVSCVLEAMN